MGLPVVPKTERVQQAVRHQPHKLCPRRLPHPSCLTDCLRQTNDDLYRAVFVEGEDVGGGVVVQKTAVQIAHLSVANDRHREPRRWAYLLTGEPS